VQSLPGIARQGFSFAGMQQKGTLSNRCPGRLRTAGTGGSDPPQAKANARISGRLEGLFSGQGCRTAKPVSLGKVWPKDEEFLKVKIYFYCFQ
jgi:hypothetical protein